MGWEIGSCAVSWATSTINQFYRVLCWFIFVEILPNRVRSSSFVRNFQFKNSSFFSKFADSADLYVWKLSPFHQKGWIVVNEFCKRVNWTEAQVSFCMLRDFQRELATDPRSEIALVSLENSTTKIWNFWSLEKQRSANFAFDIVHFRCRLCDLMSSLSDFFKSRIVLSLHKPREHFHEEKFRVEGEFMILWLDRLKQWIVSIDWNLHGSSWIQFFKVSAECSEFPKTASFYHKF